MNKLPFAADGRASYVLDNSNVLIDACITTKKKKKKLPSICIIWCFGPIETSKCLKLTCMDFDIRLLIQYIALDAAVGQMVGKYFLKSIPQVVFFYEFWWDSLWSKSLIRVTDSGFVWYDCRVPRLHAMWHYIRKLKVLPESISWTVT